MQKLATATGMPLQPHIHCILMPHTCQDLHILLLSTTCTIGYESSRCPVPLLTGEPGTRLTGPSKGPGYPRSQFSWALAMTLNMPSCETDKPASLVAFLILPCWQITHRQFGRLSDRHLLAPTLRSSNPCNLEDNWQSTNNARTHVTCGGPFHGTGQPI